MKKRIYGLDFLRALAVILVLFRHSDLENNALQYFGWLGVDLFFVLSGFLVAGLVFKEYQEQGRVEVRRFLARRILRILPPFYFFVLVTLCFTYFLELERPAGQAIFSELFYLQNYLSNIWIHTWTLAVEAHFYLGLGGIMLLIGGHQVPYERRLITLSLVGLLLFSFLMRWFVAWPHRSDAFFAFVSTHLRSDGILVGIALAYWYHFTAIIRQLLKYRIGLFLLAGALIAPGFYFPAGSFAMNTVGLTAVNLGFGILLILSLPMKYPATRQKKRFSDHLAAMFKGIGLISYSVYLWHLNCKELIYTWFSYDAITMTVLYFLLSLLVGSLLYFAVEKTALKIRSVYFDRRSTALKES